MEESGMTRTSFCCFLWACCHKTPAVHCAAMPGWISVIPNAHILQFLGIQAVQHPPFFLESIHYVTEYKKI